ncbi:MAG: hypothetical protein JSS78_04455 [Bacteroidetes bacterium]|nr:hypothetical protein [Bacteroidota bacterium]
MLLRYLTTFCYCLYFLLPIDAFAQGVKDSVIQTSNSIVESDSTINGHSAIPIIAKKKKLQQTNNPKKAGLYSAILLGSGQLYNKQYWKIPIIYAGAGAAFYFIQFNSQKYQTYRKAYIAALEGKPNEFTGKYDLNALKQLQDGYKRYLDMTVLFTVVGYTLQVIDAIVFSHLKNFDMSPDISVHFTPVIYPTGGVGMGMAINFK